METNAAPTEAVNTQSLDAAATLADMSMWSLFLHAGTIVQLVILGLIFASVMSWVIIFEKWSANKDCGLIQSKAIAQGIPNFKLSNRNSL